MITGNTGNPQKADLVVIGGGGSGLAAAIAAAESGIKKIVVLEKRRKVGGTSALAGGIFACESPVQVRQKIVADRDDMFHRAMDWPTGARSIPESSVLLSTNRAILSGGWKTKDSSLFSFAFIRTRSRSSSIIRSASALNSLKYYFKNVLRPEYISSRKPRRRAFSVATTGVWPV